MDNQEQNNPYITDNNEQSKVENQNPYKQEHVYTESWMGNNQAAKGTTISASYYSQIPNSQGNAQNNTTMSNAQGNLNYTGQQTQGGAYVQPKQGQGIAIAGMVCGIVSVLACCTMIFDLAVAIPGLIFSIIALNKKYYGKGMAITGLVCSIVGIVFCIAFMIFAIIGEQF